MKLSQDVPTRCLNITTISDNETEGEEIFLLILTIDDNGVNLHPLVTMVIIADTVLTSKFWMRMKITHVHILLIFMPVV